MAPQRLLFLAFLPLLLMACQPKDEKPPFDANSQKAVLKLRIEGGDQRAIPFSDFHRLEALPGLSYDDHLFGESRRFVGLKLSHLRHLMGADDSHKVLKFHCRDGFVSEVEAEVLEQGQFLLAFRDVDAAPETFLDFDQMLYLQNQPEVLTKKLDNPDLTEAQRQSLTEERDHLKTLRRDMKKLRNPGPFYPIFIPNESLPAEKVWHPPFSVDEVTFAKTKTDRTAALPEGLESDHPAVKGSQLFKSRCASCHSINGIGGKVGPELNRPMSVTEYWDETALRLLLQDPSKVRENSKMPALHLKPEMIEELLAYLSWMGKNKKL